jgi:hypothetical protein
MRLPSIVACCWVALLPLPCRAQDTARPLGDSADAPTTAAVMRGMSDPLAADLHLRMTPLRTPAPGDSARAAALLVAIRERVARFRDVRAALADGYRPFLRGVRQLVYHYTSRRNALAERFRFDPAAPTSLLYRQDSAGTLVLVGVMYSEAPGATLEELDRRVPLSIARWHQHVNLCLPTPGSPARWRDSLNGQPVFGPRSLIATPEACAAAGGRFVPRLFGWMVHINAFAGDDPAAVWGGHEMHEHTR